MGATWGLDHLLDTLGAAHTQCGQREGGRMRLEMADYAPSRWLEDGEVCRASTLDGPTHAASGCSRAASRRTPALPHIGSRTLQPGRSSASDASAHPIGGCSAGATQ